MDDLRQGVGAQGLDDDVDVVGHDAPGVQPVAVAIEILKRVGDDLGDHGLAQMGGAMAGIEPGVDLFGPAVTGFLLSLVGLLAGFFAGPGLGPLVKLGLGN